MDRRINIEMHFFKDYVDILRTRISSEGFQIDHSMSDSDFCHLYFNYQKRKIQMRPRTIQISKEFQCPPELQAGLASIKRKILQGEDLTPHLPLEICDLDYNDLLLNDWGIHHLHLGIQPHPTRPKFVERTGPVLFVKFENDTAYFLTVMEHGRGHSPWFKQELVKIIHKNWPEIISQYRLNIKSTSTFSDKEIRQSRRNRINTILTMDDGTTYIPIGRGYSSSGESIDVVRICDFFATILKDCEDVIRNNIDRIAEECENRGIRLTTNLKFRLEVINDNFINSRINFCAVEEYSKIKIHLTIPESNNQYQANIQSLHLPISH